MLNHVKLPDRDVKPADSCRSRIRREVWDGDPNLRMASVGVAVRAMKNCE